MIQIDHLRSEMDSYEKLIVDDISVLIGLLKRTERKEKKKIVQMIQILMKQKRENKNENKKTNMRPIRIR